jgi:carboxymethylenebutenolidase
MGTKVTLEAADGFRLGAYRADPVGPVRGGVVVIQEIFGVNHHIRSICDRLADAGYRAIAPQLFDRIEPNFESGYTVPEVTYARGLAGRVDWAKMVVDTFSAVDALKRDGPVAIMGFCMGGSVAFLASARFGGLAAAICYYGGQIARNADQKPKCPVQMHFGEDDEHISMDDVETIRQKRPECEIYVYHGAGHAFSNEDRSSYELRSAKIAWQRSLALLTRVFATAKSKQLAAAATQRHGAGEPVPEPKTEKAEPQKSEAKKIEAEIAKPETKKVEPRKPAKPETAKPAVKIPAAKKVGLKKSEPRQRVPKKVGAQKPKAKKPEVKKAAEKQLVQREPAFVKKPRAKQSEKPKSKIESKIAPPAKRKLTKRKPRETPVKKSAVREPKARSKQVAKARKVTAKRRVKAARKAKARHKVARRPNTKARTKIQRKRKAKSKSVAERKASIPAGPKARPKPKSARKPKRRIQKPQRKPAVKMKSMRPKRKPAATRVQPKPKAKPKLPPKPPEPEPKPRSIWGFGLFSSPNYRRGRF